MLGKPKYKIGDEVQFEVGDAEYQGKIYIVDKYGTFWEPNEVCYDVLATKDGEQFIIKHLHESWLKKIKNQL